MHFCFRLQLFSVFGPAMSHEPHSVAVPSCNCLFEFLWAAMVQPASHFGVLSLPEATLQGVSVKVPLPARLPHVDFVELEFDAHSALYSTLKPLQRQLFY